MRLFRHILFIFFLHSVLTLNAFASISTQGVPPELKKWIPWVLKGHENKQCPKNFQQRRFHCVWSSPLKLNVNQKGGTFSQTIEVLTKNYVALLGNEDSWPLEIKANGKPIPVTKRNSVPTVLLKKGTYRITGKFIWSDLPESIVIPRHTSIIQLNLQGKKVTFPELDSNQTLWLKRKIQVSKKTDQVPENRIEMKVFRHISDQIPLKITTNIQLKVSGDAREVKLGKPLLKGVIPLSISSRLPTRLDSNGELRVQIRPGNWQIWIQSRSTTPVFSLQMLKNNPKWAKEEVWVFEAKNHLRQTSITNVDPIDPQQTTLTSSWKKLPTYFILPKSVFKIKEIKRGNKIPAPNQLRLSRTYWLDFAGKGFTVQDQVSGTMNQKWRLEIKKPFQLGRASVNGKNQLITKSKTEGIGVPIRKRSFRLVADSRLNKTGSIPALGWLGTFDSVSGKLKIPHGWKFWGMSGADSVSGSWLEKWTLLDLFFVFLIFISVFRIWGPKWGVLALATLFLTFHEAGSPRWIWLHIIVSSGLLMVLPEGKLSKLMKLYKGGAIVILFFIVIPFIGNQVKYGLYPQLEPSRSYSYNNYSKGSNSTKADYYRAPSKPSNAVRSSKEKSSNKSYKPKFKRKLQRRQSQDKGGYFRRGQQQQNELQSLKIVDPNAKVQTGPGIPRWSWKTVSFSWNGPVDNTQTIRFFMTPPWLNRILFFAYAILWGLVLFCVSGVRYRKEDGLTYPEWKTPDAVKKATTLLVFLMALSSFGLFSNQAQAGEIPSLEMLRELRKKVLKDDQCHPNCALISKAHITSTQKQLQIRLEAHAFSNVAFPLPHNKGWKLERVLINGKVSQKFLRGGESSPILVPLSKGRHQIVLTGVLNTERSTIPITFPIKPYYVEIKNKGWKVIGVRNFKMNGKQIQLKRIRKQTKAKQKAKTQTFDPSELPSFVRLERTIYLGLDWYVETKITRVTSSENSLVLQIPLLEGESVTTGKIRVKNGKAEVTIQPGERQVTIHSLLKKSDQISLQSKNTTDWIEIWKVFVGPLWQAKFTGIPVVHHQNSSGQWLPEWRPWPNEKVSLNISRPKAIVGQTLTIDQSQLTLSVGKNLLNATLNFQIRSSLGTRHKVTLPKGAKVKSVRIRGRVQSIQQKGSSVILPILPQSQKVVIKWVQRKGISLLFTTPKVNLGIPNVNTKIKVNVPRDRWLLWAGGPRLGPAVLFWGQLLLLLTIAFFMGRIKSTPLKARHWIILALGLGNVSFLGFAAVAVWLIAMGWRKTLSEDTKGYVFNFTQIALTILTVIAFSGFYATIHEGLLGGPTMSIQGNGSYSGYLYWYQDHSNNILPTAWFLSVPILVYRLAMLAWALWMAFSLLAWLRWCWDCYNTNGLWKAWNISFWKKKKNVNTSDQDQKIDHVKE
ncbi:MAG: hypothetical protein ACI86H_001684 [bacterium]|jgi:hypothetical protein